MNTKNLIPDSNINAIIPEYETNTWISGCFVDLKKEKFGASVFANRNVAANFRLKTRSEIDSLARKITSRIRDQISFSVEVRNKLNDIFSVSNMESAVDLIQRMELHEIHQPDTVKSVCDRSKTRTCRILEAMNSESERCLKIVELFYATYSL